MNVRYCEVPGCERMGDRGRALCPMHEKRRQRGRPIDAPVAERLSPSERFIEACNALADADTDEQYTSAERAAMAAHLAIVRLARAAEIKRSMARAKAAGRHVGRPPKVAPEQVLSLYRQVGSIRATARSLALKRETVRRVLRAYGRKGDLSGHGRKGNLSGPGLGRPRAGGGST